MPKDWQELTKLTGSAPVAVERVRLLENDIAIEGEFDLPPLARLSAEDQVFIMAFVRSHGSIKEMERLFGISYPTVKNRLNRISESFQMVEIESKPSHSDVLDELERGEITPEEAIGRMSR
jgi:hypothetical protein